MFNSVSGQNLSQVPSGAFSMVKTVDKTNTSDAEFNINMTALS